MKATLYIYTVREEAVFLSNLGYYYTNFRPFLKNVSSSVLCIRAIWLVIQYQRLYVYFKFLTIKCVFPHFLCIFTHKNTVQFGLRFTLGRCGSFSLDFKLNHTGCLFRKRRNQSQTYQIEPTIVKNKSLGVLFADIVSYQYHSSHWLNTNY